MQPPTIDREAMDILFGDKVCMIEKTKKSMQEGHIISFMHMA
jgi:hypothetical protein